MCWYNSFISIASSPFAKIISKFGTSLLQGILVTLILSLVGTIVGLLIAFVFSIIRTQTINQYDSKFIKFIKKVSIGLVKIYVTVIRGTPMIVQATIFYYGFYQIGIKWDAFYAGLFTVSLNTAAYLTEVLRGGISSVDKGQMEAALSIGFTPKKAMFLIIIPQALKNSFASIGNEFIINIKDTAVLSVITIMDLYRVASIAAGDTYFYLESMLIASAVYLCLTYGASKILMLIEKRIGAPMKEITSSN